MSAPSVMHEAAHLAALTREADRLRGIAAECVERATAAIESAIAVQHHDHAAARTYVEMQRRESNRAAWVIDRAEQLDRAALR